MKKKVLSLMMTLLLVFPGVILAQYRTSNGTHGSISATPISGTAEIGRYTPARGNATVILTVGDVWGDGSGYQMLLDANATAYGSIIPETGPLTTSGDAPAATYAEFEYKIPTNADGSLSTSNIVLNSSVSIQIPAGTYDWCITNPTPGDRMWIASELGNVGGRQDDYTFEEGYTYEFVVTLNSDAGNDQTDVTISGGGGGSSESVIYDFEDGTTQGWTSIDADGDGYNWTLHAPDEQYTSDLGHNGSSYYVYSESYSNDASTALTPNNFFVSPQVTLGGSISFWAKAQDADWASEHFGVAVSTTNNTNASAFTTIQEWTLTAKSAVAGNHKTRSNNRDTGTWYEFTADLSAYSGQGYVAIRHFDCTDMFMIDIDDITIVEGGGTPAGAITFEDQQIPSSWSNDANYPWIIASPTNYPGYNGNYCLMSSNAGVSSSTSTIEATVNFVQNGSISFLAGCWGEGSNDSNDWDKCRFYIDGEIMFDYGAHQSWEQMSYEVSAGSHTFTWTYKKDSSVNPTGDFFAIDDVTFVGAGNAQTYTITATPNPLEGGYITIGYRNDRDQMTYDFEDGTTQGWTAIDADGDGFNWGLHAPDATYTNDVGHNESSYYFNSASYDNETSTALTPNNFLVSPQVTLGGTISFWAQAQDPNYAAEHFGVAVSTTSATNPSAFTTIQEWTMTAKSTGVPGNHMTRSGSRTTNTWYQFTADLSAYSGQGYVAIRHFNCTDMFILNVDDITISDEASTPTGETVTGQFADGQTCVLTAIPFTGYHFVNWTENGTVVSTNAVYSFTVTGNRTLVANFSNQAGQTYTITATPNPLEGGYITIDYRSNRTVVFSDDFENGIANWTTIDADGDGYTWMGLVYPDTYSYENQGHNSSQGHAASASYNSSAGALTPNNYLVSPQLALDGTFTFWACAQDNSWAAEHFGVAISTTNATNASAFTTIQEWTMSAKSGGVPTSDTRDGMTRDQGAWYQYTVDLSSYAGQLGYIAIRHFDCTDMFRLCIDDVELTTGDGGQMGETVSAEYTEGQTCILTAIPFDGYHFVNWTENGTVVSTNAVYSFVVTSNRTLIANFSNQAGQTYTITATPNPLEGGYITIDYRSGREEYFYDFEDGTSQGWTTIDADGDGYNWEVGSILMAGYVIPSHGDGADCMSSQSYDNDSGTALTPDNYLVSPQVALGGSISFWACAQDASYAAEHFGVAVSTTSNTDASTFTTLQEWTMTAKSASGNTGNYASRSREGREGTWYEYTVDLSDYAGQTGYIAIRHFDCTDEFYLDVDDITITEGGAAPMGETVSAEFTEGQTCILTAIPFDGYNFVNWTENGAVVATTSVYSFEVTSDRTLFANFSADVVENYTVNVLASPATGGDVTGGGTYAAGTSCTVTATANEGYDFVNWTENGEVVSTNASYTFTVNENHTLIANFSVQSYTINLTANPTEGGTLTGGGTYLYGQYCTAAATAADGYTFVNWTENGTVVSTEASYYFQVQGNRNLVANFTINSYTVTVAANPEEGGTVTGGGTFTYGQSCTVSATEAAGYTFINWTENGSFVSSELTFTFNVEADRNLVANFTTNPQPMHTITVIANPTEGGTVVGGGTYEEGQECTVTATPAAGYTFINWTEDGEEVSDNVSYSFTVTGDRTLVANFSIESYEIVATADPVAGGTVTGAGTYEYGTEITLGVTLNEGYIFQYWTEDGLIVSYDQDYTFTVTADRTLIACLKLEDDGVGEHSINVAIYPNPVCDMLNVEATETIEQVEVFTINGARVFSLKNSAEKVQINTTDLPAGTYVIRMMTKNAADVRTFVKY